MINESITFDKLPQAVSYLTEQVIELKQMVSALQPTSSANIGWDWWGCYYYNEVEANYLSIG